MQKDSNGLDNLNEFFLTPTNKTNHHSVDLTDMNFGNTI